MELDDFNSEYINSDDENNEFDSYEYDEIDYQKNEKQERKVNKLYPENKVWFKQVFKWLEMYSINDKKYSVIWDEKNPLECNFVLINNCNIIGTFNMSVSGKEPYFPISPPIVEWIEPELNFIDLCSIKYMECIRKENWNFCQNMDDILEKIYNYVININFENKPYNKLLINYLYKISEISGIYHSEIFSDLPKFGILYKNKNNNECSNRKHNGTGYSQGNVENWNIDDWKRKKNDEYIIIENIYNYLYNNNIFEYDIDNIKFSALIPYLNRLLQDSSLQEINKYSQIYLLICKFGDWIFKNIGYCILHDSLLNIAEELKFISSRVGVVLSTEEQQILDLFDTCEFNKHKVTSINVSNIVIKENDYISIMKSLQCVIVDNFENHSFKDNKPIITDQGKWFKRLYLEWKDLEKSMPLHPDGSIFIRWSANQTQLFKILIIPPLSTPYGGGCYEFHMCIPPEYPNMNPSMKFTTTGGGSVRFNPNLYSCGKICLSLLGTWNGEKWNPDISNIYQICVSILGLIFVDEPYFNEPGYQNSIGTPEGEIKSIQYNDNIKQQNIKYGIINMIKYPPETFEDVIKKHYELRLEDIKKNILNWIDKSKNPDPLKNLYNQLDELTTKVQIK